MPAGRPRTYTDEHLKKAIEYVEGEWKAQGPVPQMARLALHLGISKNTLYEWEKRPECAELADVCARVRTMQECELVDGGLVRVYDPSLCKLMLMKHGYSDKQNVDHTSSDGSMSPKDAAKSFADMYKDIEEAKGGG